MRVNELLRENYTDSMINDLMDVLTFAKGSGKSQVKMKSVVNVLDKMGYSVTPDSIVELLSGVPIVSNATTDSIHFASTPADGDDATNDSADKVAGMARTAANKG